MTEPQNSKGHCIGLGKATCFCQVFIGTSNALVEHSKIKVQDFTKNSSGLDPSALLKSRH
eukprot:15342643-Ditylum_brightwellii.AAC.1